MTTLDIADHSSFCANEAAEYPSVPKRLRRRCSENWIYCRKIPCDPKAANSPKEKISHCGISLHSPDPYKDRYGGQLRNDTKSYGKRNRHLIQSSNGRAPDEPEDAVSCSKQSKSGCPALDGYHRRNSCRNNRLVDPHPKPPDGSPDYGLVLIDSQSTLGRDDLDILRTLHTSGIPSAVMITKCDLLSSYDIERTVAYTRSEIVEHLGLHPDVVPISSKESWAPEVNRWFDATILPLMERARESLNISTNRKLQSLRNSILATLESKARRTMGAGKKPDDLENILRPIDESLSAFAQTWETKLEDILDCTSEIVANASVQMAKEMGNVAPSNRTGILTHALLRSVMSRCNPFMAEYETLSRTIADKFHNLAKEGSETEQIRSYEFPKLSGLPSPVLSFLDGLQISDPGILMNVGQSTRERHFRNELKQKASEPLTKVLAELKPRLRHWIRETIRELKDSYHAQTDPLRYRDQSHKSGISDDVIGSDIELLQVEGHGNLQDSQEADLKANRA